MLSRIIWLALSIVALSCSKMPLSSPLSGSIDPSFIINRVEPPMGPGGTAISVIGQGLDRDNLVVKFGDQLITTFTDRSEDRLGFTAAEGAEGVVLISLSNGVEIQSTTFFRTGISSDKFSGSGQGAQDPAWRFGIVEPYGYVETGRPIEVVWERSYSATRYDITLARAKDCSKPERSFSDIEDRRITVEALKDGIYYTCIFAENDAGERHPADNQGQSFTVDSTAGVAVIAAIAPKKKERAFSVAISGDDVAYYRFKAGSVSTIQCETYDGYSSPLPISSPAQIQLGILGDGEMRLCVVGMDAHGNTQPYDEASEKIWVLDSTGPLGASLASEQSFYGQSKMKIVLPPDTSDFARLKVKYKLGYSTLTGCDDGTTLLDTDSITEKVVTAYGPPGAYASWLLCSYDALGNYEIAPPMSTMFSQDMRVFITSAAYTGNLKTFNGTTYASGVEGADQRCQERADDANLGGIFRAVLTDKDNYSPFYSMSNPYYLYTATGNSLPYFSGGLFYSSRPVIDTDESGVTVGAQDIWTGTLSAPSWMISDQSSANCNGWSSDSNALAGQFGLSNSSVTSFYNNGTKACDSPARLLCVEQGPRATLDNFSVGVSGTTAIIEIDFNPGVTYPELKLFRFDYVDHPLSDNLNKFCNRSDGIELRKYNGVNHPFEDDVVTDNTADGNFVYALCIKNTNGLIDAAYSAGIQNSATKHKVFITSSTYDGDFINGGFVDSHAGADQRCDDRADAQGLPGVWKALISTSTLNAATKTLPIGAHSIISVDGIRQIASGYLDFWDGSLANLINQDETGAVAGPNVWTGSTSAGLLGSLNCNNFTDGTSGFNGWLGESQYTDFRWIGAGSSYGCNTPNPLYCIDVLGSASP